jgi:hypothetical protein
MAAATYIVRGGADAMAVTRFLYIYVEYIYFSALLKMAFHQERVRVTTPVRFRLGGGLSAGAPHLRPVLHGPRMWRLHGAGVRAPPVLFPSETPRTCAWGTSGVSNTRGMGSMSRMQGMP